jgi:catechol 2,3-dioxygenase-like lactoylglutathione lyase family enzyme
VTRSRFDHLVVGVPDLEAGVVWLESVTGIRAAGGGTYADDGAGSALASLGGRAYLGLLGPHHPEGQAPPPGSLGARLGGLPGPRLFAWACAPEAGAFDSLVAAAKVGDVPATVRDVARCRPDGRVVTARHLYLGDELGGHLPFFVDWGTTLHPSIDAPGGLRLRRFHVTDPDPDRLGELFRALGVDVEVIAGDEPGVSAVIASPMGEITIA